MPFVRSPLLRRAAALRRRLRAGLLLTIGAGAMLGVVPAAASASPTDCLGYPETRVFLEAQSWWSDTRTQSDGGSSHAHSGTCFPLNRRVSGALSLDVRSMIHNEPAGTKLVAVRLQVNQNTGGAQTLVSLKPASACASKDCTFWNRVTANMDGLARSGLTEFRVHTETERPDRSRQRASTGWYAWVDNAMPRSTSTSARWPQTEGRGWYRKADGQELGYENALLLSNVPTAPVCGQWRVKVATKAGAGGEPVSSTRVAVDPALHAMPEDPGTVVYDSAGPATRTVTIDTGLLSNGPHRLAIASRADENTDERLGGVQIIPFTVDNTLPCSPFAAVQPIFPAGMTISGDAASSADVVMDAFAHGASQVDYWVDGLRVATDASAPDFDEFLDPNTLADGPHTLVCKARINGATVASPPVQFVVDN